MVLLLNYRRTGVPWSFAPGNNWNRPRKPIQATHKATTKDTSVVSISTAKFMKFCIAVPRFLRGNKWHEDRQFV